MSNEIGTAIFGWRAPSGPFLTRQKNASEFGLQVCDGQCGELRVSRPGCGGEQDQSTIIAVVRWVECGLDDTADFVVT